MVIQVTINKVMMKLNNLEESYLISKILLKKLKFKIVNLIEN